jgi:5-methyltetrahydrofolate--homocysteine methyltransferase
MRKPLYKPEQRTLPFARRNRKEPTAEERRLWERLRDRKLEGAKFRRQGRIGPYIVDFVCLEAKLIIEIDGPLHELPERVEKDLERQRWLENEGYRVFRFKDKQVRDDIDRVLKTIAAALVGLGPSPLAPLPQGERGI